MVAVKLGQKHVDGEEKPGVLLRVCGSDWLSVCLNFLIESTETNVLTT